MQEFLGAIAYHTPKGVFFSQRKDRKDGHIAFFDVVSTQHGYKGFIRQARAPDWVTGREGREEIAVQYTLYEYGSSLTALIPLDEAISVHRRYRKLLKNHGSILVDIKTDDSPPQVTITYTNRPPQTLTLNS